MSIRFKPEEPEPATKWYYTPGTFVVFVNEIADSFNVQVRTA